jgi:hypothetical protein
VSCHRENVIWPAEDGTWNIGFYDFYSVNTDSDDWDYEWDVEYDYSCFNWCSWGHATEQAAFDSWDGSNPGGGRSHPKRDARCIELDKMLAEYKAKSKTATRYARW